MKKITAVGVGIAMIAAELLASGCGTHVSKQGSLDSIELAYDEAIQHQDPGKIVTLSILKDGKPIPCTVNGPKKPLKADDLEILSTDIPIAIVPIFNGQPLYAARYTTTGRGRENPDLIGVLKDNSLEVGAKGRLSKAICMPEQLATFTANGLPTGELGRQIRSSESQPFSLDTLFVAH